MIFLNPKFILVILIITLILKKIRQLLKQPYLKSPIISTFHYNWTSN